MTTTDGNRDDLILSFPKRLQAVGKTNIGSVMYYDLIVMHNKEKYGIGYAMVYSNGEVNVKRYIDTNQPIQVLVWSELVKLNTGLPNLDVQEFTVKPN